MVWTAAAGTGVAGAARTGGPRRAWTVAEMRSIDTSTPACDIYHALIDGHEVIDVTVGTGPRLGSLHVDLYITRVDIGLSRPMRATSASAVIEPDLINVQLAGTFTWAEPDGRTTSGSITGTEYAQTGTFCSDGLDLDSASYVLTRTARHPGGVPPRNLSLQLAWCDAGTGEATDTIGGTLGWAPAA
jgi:hypothetical protein